MQKATSPALRKDALYGARPEFMAQCRADLSTTLALHGSSRAQGLPGGTTCVSPGFSSVSDQFPPTWPDCPEAANSPPLPRGNSSRDDLMAVIQRANLPELAWYTACLLAVFWVIWFWVEIITFISGVL